MKSYKQILVVRDTHLDEKRVALTPQAVSILVYKGFRVLVETDAGINAGFDNAQYIKAGAKDIFTFIESHLLLDYKCL